MQDEADMPLPLMPGRVHEAYGPGGAAFCAFACASVAGICLWIREVKGTDVLNPNGLLPVLSPERLLIAQTKDQTDSLAVAEEALKDGSIAMAVIETSKPLNLREGRRLQLAAAGGRSTGICLTPAGMGSNAAETRWNCRPVYDERFGDLMHWHMEKNKRGAERSWLVRAASDGHLTLVD